MKQDRQLQMNQPSAKDPAGQALGRCYSLLIKLAEKKRQERVQEMQEKIATTENQELNGES